MNSLESTLYDLSGLLLVPVLLLILLSLAYAVFALGAFLVEAVQRWRGTAASPLRAHQRRTDAVSDDLEKRLEWLRITARSAPMLGLIATMIPMGPALLALTRSDARGVGENLVVAFSAVILALAAASISFLVLTVRRRWLLEELRTLERESAV
jgi:biopolymer transport protein ExbB/TolQ